MHKIDKGYWDVSKKFYTFTQLIKQFIMRKLTIFFLFFVLAKSASAQFDLTINPVSLLFSSVDISGEYGIKPSFGLEGTLGYDYGGYSVGDVDVKNQGIGIRLIGKYYFNPNRNIDKFNIGPYVKFATRKGKYEDGVSTSNITNTRFAVGFYVGYKWVSAGRFVFELGLGAGRAFVNKYSSEDESIELAISLC